MSTPLITRPAEERAGARCVRLPLGMTATALALTGIVLLAAILRFANIDEIGQSNTYYTAAVKSMLQSWHNFFYAAAEPGASVTVDKPPVGLWLQTISAYFLGVNGFAVVLPQLLGGLASVVLLFHLVRRSFGNGAGLLAAFALTVTPVAIAVERNNTPDGTLIFTLLLATWAFIKATETRRLRWLMVGAALVGIGFNIKMMQAYLPLPALYALYFFGSQQGWWRKIGHLAATTVVLLAVSFSWAVAVDLTPADQRPYIGSSSTNSVINLIVGYNGLQRLEGSQGPGGTGGQGTRPGDGTIRPDDGQFQGGPGGNAGGNAGGMFGTGTAGPLRMFQSGLAAEASWLLPFGLIMLAALAWAAFRRKDLVLGRGVILWGGWLITCVVFFSIAGFFHQYYLAMLGAPLAAVVAIGARFIWDLRADQPLRASLLLLGAAGVTLAFQVYAVSMYQSLAWWVAIPVILGAAGLAMLFASLRRADERMSRLGIALATAAMLMVPAVWSGLTTAYANTSGPTPQAYGGTGGPQGGNAGFGGRGMPAGGFPGMQNGMLPGGVGGPLGGDGRDGQNGLPGGAQADGMGGQNGGMPGAGGVNQQLLAYLQANTQDVKYLLVVPSSMAGTEYVLATGRPVLYAGGFSGNDPVIDGDKLAKLVAAGDVRYVLWGGAGGPGGGNKASVTSYLQSSCSVVNIAGLGTAGTQTNGAGNQTAGDDGRAFAGGPPGGGRNGGSTLYRCDR